MLILNYFPGSIARKKFHFLGMVLCHYEINKRSPEKFVGWWVSYRPLLICYGVIISPYCYVMEWLSPLIVMLWNDYLPFFLCYGIKKYFLFWLEKFQIRKLNEDMSSMRLHNSFFQPMAFSFMKDDFWTRGYLIQPFIKFSFDMKVIRYQILGSL
jgi:hypothetical protein